MKKIIMALGFLSLAILPLLAQAEQSKMPTNPSPLYAISFHADWCGSCKVLSPKVKEAKSIGDLGNKNVLFVRLDLTDKTTSHQSALLASTLGIEAFYKSNNGKTGFILLVNSSTGETVGKITKDMDANQISETIIEKAKSI